MSADPGRAELVRRIADLLREIVGEDRAWADAVRPDTRLDGELLLESHELAAWSLALRREHGDHLDLVEHVAGLDIDQIIELTVGDVADLVAAGRRECVEAGSAGTSPPAGS
ncbi:hypothetical protein GCM10010495_43490 [Kitasatospora herbaricolor]|uniref:hypothetical protein n=1 Tax=Kitasatospora herbaricolor TaxID=68217 RepID=UPI00174A13CA|nr:hypothetical protein [Kitasatospora herbaricolor]MDQ0306106.1 hypothetical protein [Kitasatospora herbaricolor]GGV23300.1 hypothetical protein GCM10010495_43490 [Kitasatospora herbaricolor]